MHLIDTDVISELRKGVRASTKVLSFFPEADKHDHALYISAITIGELWRGIEIIRHRRDLQHAKRLEVWLKTILKECEERILEFGSEEARIWGRLRVPHPENGLDKQIAATALTHGLQLVTRNIQHFQKLGLTVIDPFT